MIHVTAHAVDRYIERVSPVSRADAKAAILYHEEKLQAAADFAKGCEVTVHLGDVRFVMKGPHVLTTLGKPGR